MADKKISALTSASLPLAGTEVLPIVQSGATVKVAVTGLRLAGTPVQVVTANYSTATSTTSTSWTSTGLTASITPTSATNKILVLVSLPVDTDSLGTYAARYSLFRGTVSGTNLGDATVGFGNFVSFQNAAPYVAMFITASFCIIYLDSPATTSAQTYTVAMKSEGNSNPAGVCVGSAVATTGAL
jgi:hypothetical protein